MNPSLPHTALVVEKEHKKIIMEEKRKEII